MAIKLAVLLSGSGTTLQNILDRIAANEIDARVVCVISSRADAYGLERAKIAGIPAIAVPRKNFDSVDAFGEAVWREVSNHRADLVVLAGFMSLITVPREYVNRIMNVHPALVPAFSGKGMYGHHVHEAVIKMGVKVTGVTVHFVDPEYDHGPIILQAAVPVEEGDTPETLAERVQAMERHVYPRAIKLFAERRLTVVERKVKVLKSAP